jgi:hypothetical protein
MSKLIERRQETIDTLFVEWLSESLGREVQDPRELSQAELLDVAYGVFLSTGIDWRNVANRLLNSSARRAAEGYHEFMARVTLMELGGDNGKGPVSK